jgi:uncharacterized protein YdeI (YjbR/CyaY-like superfamily)
MEPDTGRFDAPVMAFPSAPEWEEWLLANHTTSTGIWLALPRKGTDSPSVTRAEAVDVALCWGWIDGQTASSRTPEGWWELRFTPRRPRSRWSKINIAKVEALIAQGRMRPAGMDEVRRARRDGRWEAAYDSPRTARMPPDLRSALDGRPGAAERFDALPAGDRYRAFMSLHHARRPETRARRIAAVLDRLDRMPEPTRRGGSS